jgi:hypothetical protein
MVDIPAKQLSTPLVKSNTSPSTAPVRSEMEVAPSQHSIQSALFLKRYTVDTSGMNVAGNTLSAPSGTPTPSLPTRQSSTVANTPNVSTVVHSNRHNFANMPNVVSSNRSNEHSFHVPQTVASVVNQQTVGNENADDDRKSISSDDDDPFEFGVLYYNASHRNRYDDFPSPSSIEKAKEVAGRVLVGLSWDEFHIPFSGVDFTTHPAWIGFHAEKGYIVSFPIYVEESYASKSNYIQRFRNPTYDATKLPRSWREQFPVFPKTADLSPIPIFRFVQAVVVHCYNHNVYCPPIHTVSHLEPKGRWYRYLSPDAQHLVKQSWSSLIHTSLQDARTGLIVHSTVRGILNSTSNGYSVLTQFLALGSHPLLTVFYTRDPKPKQKTMSLEKYFDAWNETLLIDTLRGITPSDRAYVSWVVHGLHPSLRPLGERILNRMNNEREDEPLPMCFAPGQLHQYFVREALTINLSIVPRPTSGDDVNAVVHQVTGEDIEQMVVRAMNKHSGPVNRPPSRVRYPTKSSKRCYLCDADHMVRDCPKLPEMRRRLSPGDAKVVHALVESSTMPVESVDTIIRSIFTESGIVDEPSSDASLASAPGDAASVASDAETVFR